METHLLSSSNSSSCASLPPLSFHLSAIATDVDGTLLASGMRVLDSTVDAVRRAKRLGIPVFPATARSLFGVSETLAKSGALEGVSSYPGVYLNGCLAYGPDGEKDLIWESCLNEEIVRKMVAWVNQVNERVMSQPHWDEDPMIVNAPMEHGIKAVVNKELKQAYVALGGCCRGDFVYEEENQLTDGLRQFSDGHCKVVGSLVEYQKTHPINQLGLFTHSGAIIESLRHEVHELLGNSVIMAAAIPRYLELIPSNAGKAQAVEKVVKRLGFRMEDIAALGDGENDIEMLDRSGYSIAMGNGSRQVQAVADVVTATNDNGGWALAVNQLLDTVEQSPQRKQKALLN